MFLLIGKCFVLVCKHQLYQATLRAVYITVIGGFEKKWNLPGPFLKCSISVG